MRDDDTAVPHPIDLELLARLTTGSASPDEASRILVPHLLETCPSCRALYDRLQEIKGDLGYFDELVALLESETAPGLAAALEALPPAEQLRAAETDETFHTWGLCVHLIQQSRDTCLIDARRATDLAILAARIALALPKDTYHPEWVQDLQARAFASLANALRVFGELEAADRAFADAERRFSWLNPATEAELLILKSSLRREQRRYPEALEASAASLKICRDLDDRRGILSSHLLQAKAYEATEEWASACDVLRRAETEAGLADDPRLFSMVQANLVTCLVQAGLHAEAQEAPPPRQGALRPVRRRHRPRYRLSANCA